jgi:hypothetical protein
MATGGIRTLHNLFFRGKAFRSCLYWKHTQVLNPNYYRLNPTLPSLGHKKGRKERTEVQNKPKDPAQLFPSSRLLYSFISTQYAPLFTLRSPLHLEYSTYFVSQIMYLVLLRLKARRHGTMEGWGWPCYIMIQFFQQSKCQLVSHNMSTKRTLNLATSALLLIQSRQRSRVHPARTWQHAHRGQFRFRAYDMYARSLWR